MKRIAATLPLATLLVLVISATGCEDKAIGRLCDVGVDGGATSGQAIINGAALECPSRICIEAVPNEPSVDPSKYGGHLPECTARCSSDDDCGDGLTRPKTQKTFCNSGFKCVIATTTGPFCCEKLCICNDYLLPPFQTPSSCDPTNPDNKMRCANL